MSENIDNKKINNKTSVVRNVLTLTLMAMLFGLGNKVFNVIEQLNKIPQSSVMPMEGVHFIDLRTGQTQDDTKYMDAADSAITSNNLFVPILETFPGCDDVSEENPFVVLLIDQQGAEKYNLSNPENTTGYATVLDLKRKLSIGLGKPDFRIFEADERVSVLQYGDNETAIHEGGHVLCVQPELRRFDNLNKQLSIGNGITMNYGESVNVTIQFDEDYSDISDNVETDYKPNVPYPIIYFEELSVEMLTKKIVTIEFPQYFSGTMGDLGEEDEYESALLNLWNLLDGYGYRVNGEQLSFEDLLKLTEEIRINGVAKFFQELDKMKPENADFEEISKNVAKIFIDGGLKRMKSSGK